jgi:hypothetical protein
MSTESYVNRVNQGPHFEALKPVEETGAAVDQIATPSEDPEPKLDKVGPAPVFESPTDPYGLLVSTSIEHREDGTNTAIHEYGSPADDPNDNIGNVNIVKATLDSLIVSRTEFERFKTQVIVALKHMGVDTRKYFPE